MKESPILFTAEMVRAILAEPPLKVMTRRVMKLKRPGDCVFPEGPYDDGTWTYLRQDGLGSDCVNDYQIRCPYGVPGDRLWVRETWAIGVACGNNWESEDWPLAKLSEPQSFPRRYRATDEDGFFGRWRSPIHMPRWASRITLEVTDVRAERVQEISAEDVEAEGIIPSLDGPDGAPCYIEDFSMLWDQINGPGAWDRNDWVWVVEFRRV